MKKSELIIASIVELYRLGFRSMTQARLVQEIQDQLELRNIPVNRNTISATVAKLLDLNQKATGLVRDYQVMHILRCQHPSRDATINKVAIQSKRTQRLYENFVFWKR